MIKSDEFKETSENTPTAPSCLVFNIEYLPLNIAHYTPNVYLSIVLQCSAQQRQLIYHIAQTCDYNSYCFNWEQYNRSRITQTPHAIPAAMHPSGSQISCRKIRTCEAARRQGPSSCTKPARRVCDASQTHIRKPIVSLRGRPLNEKCIDLYNHNATNK